MGNLLYCRLVAVNVICRCGAQYEWPWGNPNPPVCFECGRFWRKGELPKIGGNWEDQDDAEDC